MDFDKVVERTAELIKSVRAKIQEDLEEKEAPKKRKVSNLISRHKRQKR